MRGRRFTTPMQLDLNAGNGLLTWEALRGFYAVGSTRIRLLDAVLGVSLIGAIAVPGLHFALRHFARRRTRVEGDFR